MALIHGYNLLLVVLFFFKARISEMIQDRDVCILHSDLIDRKSQFFVPTCICVEGECSLLHRNHEMWLSADKRIAMIR